MKRFLAIRRTNTGFTFFKALTRQVSAVTYIFMHGLYRHHQQNHCHCHPFYGNVFGTSSFLAILSSELSIA